MSSASNERGLTVVETMIVLAVMGALFISAAMLMSGRVSRVEFTQSVNDVQSSLQQIIAQVGAGYYANTGNFSCDGAGGSVNISGTSSGQGTNTDCIFLGKVVQFGVKDTDPEEYRVFTLAGLRKSTSIATAKPVAVAPGLTTHSTYPNASVPGSLKNGLSVAWMKSGGTNIGAVGFVSGLGQYNGTQLLSGAQQVSLVPISGSALHLTPQAAVDAIDANIAGSPVSPSEGVQICLASGTTQQSGLLTLGSNGRELSVKLDIKDGRNC